MPRKKSSESENPEKVGSSKDSESAVKKRGRPKKNTAQDKSEKGSTKKESKKKKIKAVKAEIVESEEDKARYYGVNGNLTSIGDRTTNEQRKIQSAGGVASGVARRKKKELREFARDFLMQEANPALKANMRQLGVDAEDMTNLAALFTRVFTKGVSQGDLNAARTAIEWAGMAPLQQERENEAIAKMAQVMQLASGDNNEKADDDDVVFYLPENGRTIPIDE